MVPGVLDPDSSTRALFQVGGWSWSLNNGQNKYSYVTVGTSTGFDSEIVWLRPPRFRLGITQWCPLCSSRGFV
jgi:hypothetical protein